MSKKIDAEMLMEFMQSEKTRLHIECENYADNERYNDAARERNKIDGISLIQRKIHLGDFYI